jgi:hypothetical protein
VIFALVFVALELFSGTRESATWDEPVHVMDGYLSLVRGDFRADIEHPPLLRIWAALPLLVTTPIVPPDTRRIDDALPERWVLKDLFATTHQFMYVDNDADRLLYRARFMIVLLGVGLGGLVYAWANAIFGWPAAVASLLLYSVEPNIASHARLVTTDFGVTLAIFGAVYFLWRVARHWSPWNIAGLTAFTVVAVTGKFSGLLLAPILVVIGGWAVMRSALAPSRALLLSLVLAVVSLGSVWACYGFRYLPSANTSWRFDLDTASWAADLPATTRVTAWIDRHHLLPNAYSEGLLLNRERSQKRNTFFAGSYSVTGWWYYFPAAFALKTPLAMLLLAAAGLWWLARHSRAVAPYLIAPPLIYLAFAMTTPINIGLRHILPLYPFLVLLAAAGLHALFTRGRTTIAAMALGLAVVEPALAYPHTLAFFNILAGGPSHGSEYLVDSNLDWGQDLKGLEAWMVDRHVDHINLAYFGFADPRYYGIDCTFLPGGPGWVEREQLQLPRLPGYVAVSATILRGVNGDALERDFYGRLARLTPVTTIGHSIVVYYVDTPWWM